MANKTPIRAVFNDSNIATGLSEFQSGDTISHTHGGTGLSSLGSAGQVIKVNDAGNALEFGTVSGGGSQNLFSTIAVSGQSNISADGTTDTLTFAAGSGITLTTDASTDTLTTTIASGAITNAMLAGSIAASKLAGSIGNSKLSNSSITIGSDSVSLGGTQTDLNGITSLDVDNITIDGNSITSTDTNGNISITPNGTGKVILDGLSFPTSDGTTGQVLRTDGSGNITFATVSGGGGEANQNAFSTISVSGKSDIAADSTTDTLTLAAGSNITLTTNASNDTVTITSTASGSVSEAFKTISVSGQDNVVADSATDTLTIAAGTGMTVTTTAASDTVTFATTAITSVAADTSPQLGGDLDVNGNDIVSVSNGNINLLPNGSGKVILDGNGSSGGVTITDGNIDIRTGTGAVSKVKFYCEASNAHAQTLQAQPHSAGSSAVITLPVATGTLIGSGDTGSVSNTMLAGSIAASKLAGSIGNSKLSNSSITIGSDSISLGGTQTDLNGITSLDVDNITIDGNVISSTNTNGDITLTPNGTGKVILKGITYPASDGTNGQAIVTDGSGNLSFSTISGGGGGTAPAVSSISPSTIPPSTSTQVTITGTNFASVPIVNAINSTTGAIITPSAVTYTNATTLVATFNISTLASYYIRVENATGLAGRSSNAVLAVSTAPSWTTGAGSLGIIGGGSSVNLTAIGTSDSTVSVSETTSVLTNNSDTPASTMNLTLNSSNGNITGTAPTPNATTTYNFTLRLTDAESQTADRAFSITVTGGIEQSGQFIP